MCGIIGIIGRMGEGNVAARVAEGLKRLEYRGYDSAGIATLVNGHIDRRRAEGKLINLTNRLAEEPRNIQLEYRGNDDRDNGDGELHAVSHGHARDA